MSNRTRGSQQGVRDGRIRVWTNDLNVTVIPTLVMTFLKNGRFDLHFTSARLGGAAGARALRLLGMLSSAPHQVRFTDENRRVDDPKSTRLEVQGFLPNQYAAHFAATYQELLGRLKYPDPRVSKERILVNIQKAVGEQAHSLLRFVEFAKDQDLLEDSPSQRLIIVTTDSALAASYPKRHDWETVKLVCPWSRHSSLSLRMARAAIRCVSHLARRRKNHYDGPRTIAVQSTNKFDRLAKNNDLFWWWNSDIPADQVLLFYDRSDQTATAESIDLARNIGLRCAVLEPEARGDSPQLVFRANPTVTSALKRLWRALRVFTTGIFQGTTSRWVSCRVMDMMHHSEHIEDFLIQNRVGALMHYQTSDMDYYSLACDAAGAARIGFQWSNHPWPEVSSASVEQVHFFWGPYYAKVQAAAGSTVDHNLVSGCTIPGAHPGSDASELESWSKPNLNGASRVLALFDTSLPCEGFYDFFLRKMIEDERWGLLIKPKPLPDNLPWALEPDSETRVLFDQAMATGRVKLYHALNSPIEAAQAADFSVGVDINSAVLVAALAGRRALHLDYARVHQSPLSDWAIFHRSGPDRLVFDDPEKLWASINRHLDEPGSDPDLGLLDDSLLQEVEPFLDGQGGRRIGDFLKSYLDSLENGLSRDDALSEATSRYVTSWGEKAIWKDAQQPSEAGLIRENCQKSPEPSSARGRQQ